MKPSTPKNDHLDTSSEAIEPKRRFRGWKGDMLIGALCMLTLILLAFLITGIVLGGPGAAIPYALMVISAGIAGVTGISIGAGGGILAVLAIGLCVLTGGVNTLIQGLCFPNTDEEMDDLRMPCEKPAGSPNAAKSATSYQPANHFDKLDPFSNPNISFGGRALQPTGFFPTAVTTEPKSQTPANHTNKTL